MKYYHWLPFLRVRILLLGIIVVSFVFVYEAGWALSGSGAATVFPPNRIGGASGYNNGRDADFYPAIAYDPATGRYLAVWLTLRNAQSYSDGFDVYGVFLDRTGKAVGNEFRISDRNTVARNGLPAVAAGNGEFAVAWTVRGTSCQLYVQRVTDASPRSDRVLISGTGHRHSPSLVYDLARHRYVVAYVEGDDYLPPSLFGAQTTDCGNNASSTSRIKAMGFYFGGDSPVVGSSIDISDRNTGAFRPRIAYSPGLRQYLVAWEDRRNASGRAYRFDIYAQRLGNVLTITESDVPLATGGDYTNYDTSATWTPRPVVAGGDSHFLVSWFERRVEDSAVIWSVKGRLVPASGAAGTPFTIAEMPFAQSHAGQSPTGFLAAIYLYTAKEYLVGMTSHLESIWGYMSFALVQRVSNNGQLLKMDGNPQSDPRAGYSVDYENEDQIVMGIAANPVGGVRTANYMVVYGKHLRNRPAQDYDIWSVRIQIPAPYLKSVYLPSVCKGR
jgi:hypothetical protein